ncbi:MAG: FAD-dependent monooxygenase, partial [Caldimonas sp.]
IESHPSRSTDRWCITDVRFKKPLPVERWTWIDAPFNEGRAVWQHFMADDVWRLDYQMDEHADPQAISRPEVAGERLRAQLGPGVEFEFVWIGPYQYRDHLLETFRVGRVVFVGDSAHVVCPFGARGGNNGIQDAANLGWKLALVLRGEAGVDLVDSYHAERHPAAAENLRVTTRTTRFLAPRNAAERRIRTALVSLARRHEFARRLANTGRMAQANAYPPSRWLPEGGRSVQNVAVDGATLMRGLGESTRFVGFWVGAGAPEAAALGSALAGRFPLEIRAIEASTLLARHLGVASGSMALVRPDAYLAATIERPDAATVAEAMRRALSLEVAA